MVVPVAVKSSCCDGWLPRPGVPRPTTTPITAAPPPPPNRRRWCDPSAATRLDFLADAACVPAAVADDAAFDSGWSPSSLRPPHHDIMVLVVLLRARSSLLPAKKKLSVGGWVAGLLTAVQQQ